MHPDFGVFQLLPSRTKLLAVLVRCILIRVVLVVLLLLVLGGGWYIMGRFRIRMR